MDVRAGLLLLVGLVLVATTAAQSNSSFYGNPVIERGSYPEMGAQKMYVIDNVRLPAGVLTDVRFWVPENKIGNATHMPCNVSLQVWEDTYSTGSAYTLLWEKNVTVASYRFGLHQIYLGDNETIRLNGSGRERIGFTFRQDFGCISYDYSTLHHVYFANTYGVGPRVDTLYQFDDVYQNAQFSIGMTVEKVRHCSLDETDNCMIMCMDRGMVAANYTGSNCSDCRCQAVCHNYMCRSNEVCQPHQVQCFRSPCPPQPRCVDKPKITISGSEVMLRDYPANSSDPRTVVMNSVNLTSGPLFGFVYYVHPDGPFNATIALQIWRDVGKSSRYMLMFETVVSVGPYHAGVNYANVYPRSYVVDGSRDRLGFTSMQDYGVISASTGYDWYVQQTTYGMNPIVGVEYEMNWPDYGETFSLAANISTENDAGLPDGSYGYEVRERETYLTYGARRTVILPALLPEYGSVQNIKFYMHPRPSGNWTTLWIQLWEVDQDTQRDATLRWQRATYVPPGQSGLHTMWVDDEQFCMMPNLFLGFTNGDEAGVISFDYSDKVRSMSRYSEGYELKVGDSLRFDGHTMAMFSLAISVDDVCHEENKTRPDDSCPIYSRNDTMGAGCSYGYYGDYCSACSSTCQDCLCDPKLGYCYGCKEGWDGPFCEYTCRAGWDCGCQGYDCVMISSGATRGLAAMWAVIAVIVGMRAL